MNPMVAATLPRIPGIKIVHELGQGSQNTVYLAVKDGREYALKLPREQQGIAQDSFVREAVAYACVRHPGLAELFEVGDVDGQPYAIMESVPGGTLASLLSRG